jgi:hypothetical protein
MDLSVVSAISVIADVDDRQDPIEELPLRVMPGRPQIVITNERTPKSLTDDSCARRRLDITGLSDGRTGDSVPPIDKTTNFNVFLVFCNKPE